MKFTLRLSNPFDRCDLTSITGDRQHEARQHRRSIYQYRAGTAFSNSAPVLRSREIQVIPQNVKQEIIGCHPQLPLDAIHYQSDLFLQFHTSKIEGPRIQGFKGSRKKKTELDL
jgi:hypothetical protein